jgi:AraC-like DNA-binding protein
MGQMTRSTRGIDYQDVPRPVAVLSDEYPAGFVDPLHTHPRAQLIHAIAGVMAVTTGDASYVVPPRRGLWVPAGVGHEVHCRDQVSVRTLYVEKDCHPDLPKNCRVIEISELMRALIVVAATLPIEYDEAGRDGRVMALIIDEIVRTPAIPLDVPMPQNARLLKICRSILVDPAAADSLDHWAGVAAMGRRTFTRLFRRETGMSFASWRQQVRLMEALSLLAKGEPVTQVAVRVGYTSPSAFTAVFRRTFGAAPTSYLRSDPIPS